MTIDKTLIGPAGEHLVLSRLLSRGFLAAPAPRGARKADILVNFLDGGQPLLVQVKTTMTGATNGWFLSEKHEDIRDSDLFYCFVDFKPELPEVYVMQASLVADHVKNGHAHWMATPGKNGQAHNPTSTRRMDNKAQHDGRAAGWMETYREAWEQLGQP